MAITSKDSILKVLSAYNPWWKTGVVNPGMTKEYKRFAFYEAMKKLIEDENLRTVLAKRGYETVKEAFSCDKWKESWKGVLQEYLEHK